MSADLNCKIIDFPQGGASPLIVGCEICGGSIKSGDTCLQCAVGLLDIVLTEEDTEDCRLLSEPVQPSFDGQAAADSSFGHYRICQTEDGCPWELGRGAMGITYKATDTNLGCPVALKVINTGRLTDTRSRDRLEREARAAAMVRHPNIASVFHLGSENGQCFYAMEYIEGETLEDYVLRRGPLSPAVAFAVLIQAAQALQAAHQGGFIHRDIKPANLMLVRSQPLFNEKSLLKLIDFGLVTAATDAELGDTVCRGYFAGSPRYASPEQLAGRTVDARSDIYSLGVCLQFMLLGRLPPPAENLLALPHAGADRLARSLTAADPSRRPQTAESLIASAEEMSGRIVSKNALGFDQAHGKTNWRALFCCVALIVASLIGTAFVQKGGGLLGLQIASSVTKAALPAPEAMTFYRQGQECLDRNTADDTQCAIEFFLKSIEIQPDFAKAHAGLATAYLRSVVRFSAPEKYLELAEISAQRAISQDSQTPDGFVVLGAVRAWRGRPWDALTQVHRALELNPAQPRAMFVYSLLWSSVGKPQLGLPWAKAAADSDPASPWNWMGVADLCTELCDDQQAQNCYRRCLEINPTFVEARCGQLRIHLLNSNFEAARQDFSRIEAIEPGLVLPLSLKAQVELFSGDYPAAETDYRRLLTLNRRGAVNYYGGVSYLSALGYLRLQAGDQQEANALLEEAAMIHRADLTGPQSAYDLAAIRCIQGHPDDALALLQQAVDAGWVDFRATRLDPRFGALRTRTRFHEIIDRLNKRVSEMLTEANARSSKRLLVADYPVEPQNE